MGFLDEDRSEDKDNPRIGNIPYEVSGRSSVKDLQRWIELDRRVNSLDEQYSASFGKSLEKVGLRMQKWALEDPGFVGQVAARVARVAIIAGLAYITYNQLNTDVNLLGSIPQRIGEVAQAVVPVDIQHGLNGIIQSAKDILGGKTGGFSAGEKVINGVRDEILSEGKNTLVDVAVTAAFTAREHPFTLGISKKGQMVPPLTSIVSPVGRALEFVGRAIG